MIGGGELKIDLVNMEAILKWIVPTSITEVHTSKKKVINKKGNQFFFPKKWKSEYFILPLEI